jgi:hypothetical protein
VPRRGQTKNSGQRNRLLCPLFVGLGELEEASAGKKIQGKKIGELACAECHFCALDFFVVRFWTKLVAY